METQPTPGIFERFNQWITESIMVKLIFNRLSDFNSP
jgi:hypothetical protein